MIQRLIYSLCLIFLSFLPAVAEEPLRTIDALVHEVSDGDTIKIVDSQGKTVKVHLYGVDAPEKEKSNQKAGRNKPGQPYGDEAWKALYAKVYRKRVKVDVMALRKKSVLSIIWLDGRNVNFEMVAEGWAWADRQYLDEPHAAEYIRAEGHARSGRLGLWQQSNPQSPWEFRKKFIKGAILKALSFKWFE